MKIRKGDIVGRKSYGMDIFFVVDKIIKGNNNNSFCILKGLTVRISADSPIEDLVLIEKEKIQNNIASLDKRINTRILNVNPSKSRGFFKENLTVPITGKILHLDGDKRYSEKSKKYYNEIGLNAIVKNIPENKQPFYVRSLLERYKPDILVITGHDSMLKNGRNYNDVYNYRNSKHFINTVTEARRWSPSPENLVIFAGACQSFFEGLMVAGANFASSPERILIDFIDPLIVAEKVATTDNYKYITISEIAIELKEGTKGVGGTRAKGKKYFLK